MVLRKQFEFDTQVQAVHQGFGQALHGIHDGGIRFNLQLDMAQLHAVVLPRERILVRLVEKVHFLLGRAHGTHMALAHALRFHMAPDLLRELFAVLRHAHPKLGTDGLLERRHVHVLACRKLAQVRRHALVDFRIAHHDGIAVNAAQQNLFFNQLVEHVLLLLFLGHRSAFGRFLEMVQVVQELRAHNRLPVDNRRNPFHEDRGRKSRSDKPRKGDNN